MAPGSTIPVTADNFVRAESDLYFGGVVKDGGLGKFFHNREPTPIDHQTVVRMNRDTLYSGALFDLDAGPVTITLPDPGERFMSMQVIDGDHYTQDVIYRPADHTLTRGGVGTRHVVAPVRILVDPSDPKDVAAVRSLIILRSQLEPDDGDSKQGKADDERSERMGDVHMIGLSFKPWQETGQAAGGGQPVDGRERKEHDAEKASDHGHNLGHGLRV
jgi:uncharacterized protein DUF1254